MHPETAAAFNDFFAAHGVKRQCPCDLCIYEWVPLTALPCATCNLLGDSHGTNFVPNDDRLKLAWTLFKAQRGIL